MKLITTTQCRRPYYTKQMLEYLGNCIGIQNYEMIVSIDGENEEVIELFKQFDKCYTKILINKEPLGINKNTEYVLSEGFKLTDCLLHIEEDNLLAKHSLQVFEGMKMWWFTNIGSTSLYSHATAPKEQWNQISKRELFVSVGPFGIKRDKFFAFSNAKCFDGEISYDINIDQYCKENKYLHLYTLLGQSNNIGALDAVHVPSSEWHKEFQFCDHWAETVDFELKSLEYI